MITREQHETIVRNFLTLVDWSDGHGREVILATDAFSRDELKRMERDSARQKLTMQQYLTKAINRTIEEDKKAGRLPSSAVPIEKPQTPEEVERMKIFNRVMRKARVFEIPTEAWKALSHAVFRFAGDETEALLEEEAGPVSKGLLDRVVKEVERISAAASIAPEDGENQKYMDAINQHMPRVVEKLFALPFPELLPFDSCFFMPAEPMVYLPQISHAMSLDDLVKRSRGDQYDPACFGILVSSELCAAVAGVHYDSWKEYRVLPMRENGQWANLWTTSAPWMVKALVDLVNEHKEIINEYPRGLAEKLSWKKAAKFRKTVPAPSPFYVVHLSDKYIQERKKSMFPPRPRNWQHRWDVRGHEAVRIARGALPLPEKTERDLKKRGYRIFTVNDVDVDTYRVLTERRQPGKRPGEWLAVLISWREAYVKGPEDKPYVPAAHRVSDPLDRHQENPGRF